MTRVGLRTWGSPLHPWGSADGAWGTVRGTLAASHPAYHVVVGNCGLILANGGYQRSAAGRLAAQFSIGGITNHDRITDQVVNWSNWHGGERPDLIAHETSTPDRYKRGSGINGYSTEGVLGLGDYMAAPANLQTAFTAITAMISYRGYLVLGRDDGKVYRWDGTTLALAGDTGKSTGGIKSFAIIENNLYIGNGQDAKVWRWQDATPGSLFAENFTVGSDNTVTAVPGLTFHVQEGVATGYYGANQTGKALVGQVANTGGTTSPSAAMHLLQPSVGWLGQYKTDIVAIGVDTVDKVWQLYVGDDTATIGWSRKTSPINGGTITAGAVLTSTTGDGDILYLGESTGGRIWAWDGTKLTLVHQIATPDAPYTTQILGMAAWRGALYVSILDSDGSNALLRFDGNNSWSRPVYGLTGTTPGPLCVFSDQMHFATNAAGASKVFRTDGTYIASGYAVMLAVDADLGGTDKAWDLCKIKHSALASGQSVQVLYRLEGAGSFVSLGTSSTVGATGAEFRFPHDTTSDLIEIEVILTGSAGSSTALSLYGVAFSYRPAPPIKREWNLHVLLYGNEGQFMPLVDGSTETRTGQEISAELWALVQDQMPVLFTDRDRGPQATVEIVSWSDSLPQDLPRLGSGGMGLEYEGDLTLREV